MRIADLSRLYVETDDLTEIEVVDIKVGQKVTVVADALPGVEMTGTVESISQVYEEKRGDVTYTVRILLDNPDPRLRWGMTVVVTFEE
jgi:multidrug resistance efflux pump